MLKIQIADTDIDMEQ